jgi:hypothetical protein
MKIKTSVIVRLQVEGLHCWPAAKDVFPEVAFLSDPHRHIFHIQAEKEVFHDDRDVEFIIFKRDLEEYFRRVYYVPSTRVHDFGSMSCERIATEILDRFNCLSVEVWEDLENGARVVKQEDAE